MIYLWSICQVWNSKPHNPFDTRLDPLATSMTPEAVEPHPYSDPRAFWTHRSYAKIIDHLSCECRGFLAAFCEFFRLSKVPLFSLLQMQGVVTPIPCAVNPYKTNSFWPSMLRKCDYSWSRVQHCCAKKCCFIELRLIVSWLIVILLSRIFPKPFMEQKIQLHYIQTKTVPRLCLFAFAKACVSQKCIYTIAFKVYKTICNGWRW